MRSDYQKIYKTIEPYQELWSQEVLSAYPHHRKLLPKSWLESLLSLSPEQMCEYDHKHSLLPFDQDLFPESMVSFHKELFSIKEPDDFHQKRKKAYPSWAMRGVKGKKQHEIERLLDFIENQDKPSESFYDFCGGQGHLARVLAHYHGRACLSFDYDQNLQELGKKRAALFPLPKQAASLEFSLLDLFNDDQKKQAIALIESDSTLLGLHTCGSLANNLFDIFHGSKSNHLIQLGCCYNKIQAKHLNLSQVAKKFPLPTQKFALTLATRSHNKIRFSDFLFKLQVKKYRYALHLLLFNLLGEKEITPVGDSHRSVYQKDFVSYAKIKAKECGRKLPPDKEIDQFFHLPQTQKEIQELFSIDLLRWHFARPIEQLILLDRALYLQELGHQARLVQVFDPAISPRNIAISVSKNSG